MIEQLAMELKSITPWLLSRTTCSRRLVFPTPWRFSCWGELVEHAETGELFRNPRDTRTQDYLTGRFG